MAAPTESVVVSALEEVNHKEAYSDFQENQNISVKVDVSNEEAPSTHGKDEETKPEGTLTEAKEVKEKFVEAPIPKVNPWVNRTGSKPAQKQNQPSK